MATAIMMLLALVDLYMAPNAYMFSINRVYTFAVGKDRSS